MSGKKVAETTYQVGTLYQRDVFRTADKVAALAYLSRCLDMKRKIHLTMEDEGGVYTLDFLPDRSAAAGE